MKHLILISLLLASHPVFAGDAAQEQLRKQYVNSSQTLNKFYSGNYLKYDSDGNFVGKSDTGPWTVYGYLLINSVNLKSDKLEMLASRTVLIYEPEHRRFVARPWKAGITLEIATHAGPDRLQQLQVALRHIFVNSAAEMLAAVPDYWKPFVLKTMTIDSAAGSNKEPAQPKADSQSQHVTTTPGTQPGVIPRTLRISSGVAEGLLIKKVEPSYVPIAKAARVQGDCIVQATIGKDGHVANLAIVQPVGAGLDDESFRALSQWEYRPYRLQGQPVEVQTTLTVRFHIE